MNTSPLTASEKAPAGRGILLLPVGGARVASVRYRVLAYRPALEEAGFATRLRLPLGGGGGGPRARAFRLADLSRDAWGRDPERIVLVHRKTYPPFFARRLRRHGRCLVFDADDALDLPPPGGPTDPATLGRYRRNFEATAHAADIVVCGNSEIASRLPHDRHVILPTPVDTDRFRPGATAPARGATVGWVGHSDNLGYLQPLAGVFRELARRHSGFRLVVVCDQRPDLPGVPVEFRLWTLEDEVACFGDLRAGLMPLEDSPWARAKCAFKALQYMALGIPAVVSPVGMNREVIRDGENGFLPRDPAEWLRVLDRLLTDGELAARVGDRGRRTVEAGYSLSLLSRRLLRILEPSAGAP